jgi:methylthioribose-1-phosphate isomerase
VKIGGKDYRTVWLDGRTVRMIDQRLLPHRFRVIGLRTVAQVCEAISDMAVRGAPAIGAAGCYGMALAELTGENPRKSYSRLLYTRPTAHDLKDGLDYYLGAEGSPAERADGYADASAQRCRMIGVHGARLIKDGMRVLTHCNAGAIACVDWGTALAPMRVAWREGVRFSVWVDETRPRLQGARLTAWELGEEGIAHKVVADNAAGHLMAAGEVDLAIVGADRIAANGDVANKIGTYEKAVLAGENGVPFYVAAPSSTFDRGCKTGGGIPIEVRDGGEIACVCGVDGGGRLRTVRILPNGSDAYNPAFDVTPARFVTGYVTEDGISRPKRSARRV